MPMELRKRKAPEPAPAPAPKKTSKVAEVAAKVKQAVTGKKQAKPAAAAATSNGTAKAPAAAAAAASSKKPSKGDVIALDGFGGEVETNDGNKVTLKSLVDESKAGVVLFTYPKASTPGCTNQACLFRDSYAPLTAGGLSIYGLSADSPRANTAFRERQRLPYPLLCDPAASLIGAVGLRKAPKGTQRGVFVVDKAGRVLAAEAGSPAGTVEVVKKLVAAAGAETEAEVAAAAAGEGKKEEEVVAAEEKKEGEADGVKA
ncbi:uncharacterized protein E0L32_002396 [Thyridium curvatum]|uniref:thioredoxin-dependent peroxiredoxin n=1 Tax=Thyridium curvatum TaxID=1093900 RepID=A0A507ART4_9PEZI|nr:uncharacterized protein E0L32_002396 [Thyridium curvatum]TPX06900.1 hypothetical protein E0L32_002396 [Thyridium curvatum]